MVPGPPPEEFPLHPLPRDLRDHGRLRQDVREYAAMKGLEAATALEAGLKEKAEEFREKGAELYVKG